MFTLAQLTQQQLTMAALTLVSGVFLLRYIYSQPVPSCYEYGCGFYSSSQSCQCNPQCVDFGDCCSDFNSLCQQGNFEDCPSAPIIKGDRRINKNILRFVSFNIEWLFLDYSHSMGTNFCPGNGCSWHNATSAYIHMRTGTLCAHCISTSFQSY